ncbi:MAG: decaprenyl-phosphate phosphoribosyltransferase [Anaerolineaceae bacterium]|nr:decaprenyl-phosphate phosphoribosyltransferase [Anaerolineaceae bacterium]
MFRALLKAMRLRQWIKNGVLLAPLLFDTQATRILPLLRSLAAFGLFCLLSSAVYLVNDIFDIDADRQHPQKKNRPIASGKLPISVAIIAVIILLIICLVLGYLLSPWLALIEVTYFLLMLAYSRWLKHMPLIDVLVIAGGFVLRVLAGLSVITVKYFSPWLFVVTTLLALFLGFGKRRSELAVLTKEANAQRRVLDGYTIPLLDQIITVVTTATILTYSLYTFSAEITPGTHTMMLTIPFVLYGILRYLWLIQVKHAGGAPDEALMTDRPMQAAVLLWCMTVFIILYVIQY